MGKRFVPVRDADKRAIEFHLKLEKAKEKLPLVEISIRRDDKTPIIMRDQQDPNRWDYFSIDGFLRLSVDQALANGGTYSAFVTSRRPPPRPKLPQAEIDRAVDQFLGGDDKE